MQQLTLQFEGYADNRQPETQGTATQCSKTVECSHAGNVVFPYWEITLPTLGIKSALSAVILFAQTTLFVCFCFALIFLTAILQG